MTTTHTNITTLPRALKQGALALAGALLLATACQAAVTKAQFTQIKADAKKKMLSELVNLYAPDHMLYLA